MNDKIFIVRTDFKFFKVIMDRSIGDKLYYRNDNGEIHECKICYYKYEPIIRNGVSLDDYIPYVGVNIASLGQREICIKCDILKNLYYSVKDALMMKEVIIINATRHIYSVLKDLFAVGCTYVHHGFYGFRPMGNEIVSDRIGIPSEHFIFYLGGGYCVESKNDIDLDYKYFPTEELAAEAMKDYVKVITFDDNVQKDDFQTFNLTILNQVIVVRSKEQLDEIQKLIDKFK